MKQLQIHCIPANSYYYFYDSIKSRSGDYIALLPVNRAVRLLRQKLLNSAPGGVLPEPFLFTFDQLLLDLYQYRPAAKRVLSADMVFVLLESLLQNNQQDLSYLMKVAHITPGLVQKISNVVQELRRFGFDSSAFNRAEVEDKKNQPQKYKDFYRLLLALEDRFGSDFIDEPFARHTAAQELTREIFFKRFPKVRTIFIAGFGLYTPAMLQFINKVSDWISVEVKLEYSPQNPELFLQTQEVFSRMQALGAAVQQNMGSSILAKRLFNRKAQSDREDLSKRIHLRPAQNRQEEVAFIAAEIRRLCNEGKIPIAKIAVTFPHLERYVPLIREEFKKFGIPYNLSTGFSLKQSPLIRSFLKPLEWIQSGYVWSDLLILLQSPLLVKQNIDISSLHRFLVEQRMKRLTPGWPDKIINSTAFQHMSEEEQSLLAETISVLSEFLKPFYIFPQQAEIGEFRTAFIQLLKQMNLLHWYTETPNSLNERNRENEFRAFNRFMKLMDRLVWMLSHLQTQQKITLETFLHHLEMAVTTAVYNLTEWQEYGVQILPRLEVQALEAQVLFVGGLVDGEFPRASAKDVFFSDPVREELGLLATEELLTQDRFIFYSLLDSAAKQVYCVYPLYEEDRALVASTFLSDLAEAVQVDPCSETPPSSLLLNRSQIWQNFGKALQKRDWKQAEIQMNLLRFTDNRAETQLRALLSKIALQLGRHMPDRFGKYEGNLEENKEIVAEMTRLNARRKWSVSRLEQYAFCPLQYFFEQILDVAPWPEFEDDLTALERGNALHRIFQHFYETLQNDRMDIEPWKHRDLLFQIAGDEFAQLPFSGFFWDLEQKKYFGTDSAPGLFDVFLATERDEIESSGFLPHWFEHAFGASDGEVTLSTGNGELRMRGRIDRVDLRNEHQAMIIDYKTGTSALNKNVEAMQEGISFQLPLYLRALIQENPQFEAVAAVFYIVKDAEHCERKIMIGDRNALPQMARKGKAWLPHNDVVDEQGNRLSLNELTLLVLHKAISHVESLKKAHFRHTAFPEDKMCSEYCVYKNICQKQTGKILKYAERQIVSAAAEGEEA